MGEEWQKARDARVAEVKRRQTVWSSYENVQKMVNEVKAPITNAVAVFLRPDSGYKEKFKALLKLRRAAAAFKEFPEPTLENTWNDNSHLILRARDEFFKHCVGLAPERLYFMRMVINFIVILNETDPPYRMMFNFWAKALGAKEWNHDIPVTVVGHEWPWWKE